MQGRRDVFQEHGLILPLQSPDQGPDDLGMLLRGQRGQHSDDGRPMPRPGRPGQGVGQRADALEHAELANSTPYEILCNISKRVPRRYVG